MSGKYTQVGKLTREYIAKFPSASVRTITQKLMQDHPMVFSDYESARNNVRYHSGLVKDGMGRKIKDPVKRQPIQTRENPFGLPEPETKGKKIHRLPTNCNNILWLSDIHFPNQDNESLTAALNYGIEQKINCIVLGGDILDNTPFTSFLAPPPNRKDAKRYFDIVSSFIDTLKKKFNCPIFWIEGNHDQWYERWMMKKAPMIWDDEYYSIEQRLGLKQRGVTYLKQNVILKAGKLNLQHGHTVVKGVFAPVNPARGVFLKTKVSTLIGHCHQSSEHSEGTANDDLITCYSTGCLCTLSPDYDPHNTKHNHGFAHIRTEKNGHFHVVNKRIYQGNIL